MNTANLSLRPQHRSSHGFTLIEVMVVVIIVAILAAVAIPSYQQHIIKSNRAAAESFMLQIANKEEQYALDARNYTAVIGIGGLNLTTPGDVNTRYVITIANLSNTTYTITATPTAIQKDTQCGTLTLNQAGVKTPAANCW